MKENEQTFKKIQQETFTKLDERQKQETSKMQEQTEMVLRKCE